MNLPNRLTILRVCLIPVFIVFLMLDEMLPWARYAAVGVFIAACITDFFDGRSQTSASLWTLSRTSSWSVQP